MTTSKLHINKNKTNCFSLHTLKANGSACADTKAAGEPLETLHEAVVEEKPTYLKSTVSMNLHILEMDTRKSTYS